MGYKSFRTNKRKLLKLWQDTITNQDGAEDLVKIRIHPNAINFNKKIITINLLENEPIIPPGGGEDCWVATEIFGHYYHPKTQRFRNFLINTGPKWFYNLYHNHGKDFSKTLREFPILKIILRPLFEFIVWITK